MGGRVVPRPYVPRDGKGAEIESFALVATLGALPTRAVLRASAGASGRVVTIRRPVASDDAEGADLVVEVPEWRSVQAPLLPVAGGELRGFSDRSARYDEGWLVLRAGERSPFTVESRGEGQVRVILRDASATGVVLEDRHSRMWMVRDWFHATGESLELACGGEGRFVSVTSNVGVRVLLVWVPKDPNQRGFAAKAAGSLAPGETKSLWVPAAAERLQWYAWEPSFEEYGRKISPWATSRVLGETLDLSASKIALK